MDEITLPPNILSYFLTSYSCLPDRKHVFASWEKRKY